MIKLNVIFYPFIIFIIILILHIIIWRVSKPQKQIVTLFLVFLLLPCSLLIITFIILYLLKINPISIEDFILILLFYFTLSGVYIQTFPSIQAGSPSLFIVNLIGRNNKPISTEIINKGIRKENFINDRIDDLKKERLIIINNNSIILTKRGKVLSSVFILYRKFIGLKEGEG